MVFTQYKLWIYFGIAMLTEYLLHADEPDQRIAWMKATLQGLIAIKAYTSDPTI